MDSTAYQRVVAALKETGLTVSTNGNGKAIMAQCPAHDDGTASLRVTQAALSALIHCHAGCDTKDVLAKLNMTPADLFDGEIRYDFKGGRKVHRSRDKKFRQSGNTKDTSLFQAEDIGDAETVYVTEGEKDAANLAHVYHVAAVSAPCGAGSAADKWDWTPLSGKHAIVIADKDETGRTHAEDVAAQLHPIAKSVVIAESAVGKDISDHIAAGKELDELVVSSLLDKLSVTSEWLEAQQFPDLEQIVPGIIVEGVTVLAGPPKVGKSFLVANLALAVVSGGKALGAINVKPRPVLVLALEDGHRRLQYRYREIYDGAIPPGITFVTKATPAECVSVIAEYFSRHERPLIILDTLGKVKQAKRSGEESYTVDYELGGKFKALADSRPGCAIIIIHHTRKADATDFVDQVSGTHGIAGSVDSIVTLNRKRREAEATMSVTGRDVTESEYALIVADGFRWQLDGGSLPAAADAADERREHAAELARLRNFGKRSVDVVRFVNERGHVTPVEVAFRFHMTPKVASNTLNRLANADFIVQALRGEFHSKLHNASIGGDDSDESEEYDESGEDGVDGEDGLSPGNTPLSPHSSSSSSSSHPSDVVRDIGIGGSRRTNTCRCGAPLTQRTSRDRGMCAQCWSDRET
jgi:hypothetical protein